MASRSLMMCLLGVYIVIAVIAVYEQKWPVVLYWLSAAGILSAVLWMGK